MAFSTMLKQLREERHLSQKDISEYLGITRQAVASYENGKREPDYDTLRKLADYFSVSIDYLLGRANSRDLNALTIAGNIELIRGNMTYKEMAEDIGRKVGALIFPEMLELYAKGERMPFSGSIKILARYARVRDSFFYSHNTPLTYEKEQELYKMEVEQSKSNDNLENSPPGLEYMENGLKEWVMNEKNYEYIKLAKEIYESGLPVAVLKPLIESIKGSKK
ncbi:MAG: helix-turn-helix domain-containing protein [Clostridia bacterium]|nr:helix-turn-helix domain-containing protein [Clostridia bacterium]